MYEIITLTEALAQLREIERETDDDEEIAADFDLIELLLETVPLRVGSSRISSVHRLLGRGRLMVEYEVIEDDKRVLLHSFSLLPGP